MCVCVCVCVFSLADPLLGHRCWSVCVCVCVCVVCVCVYVCVFTCWPLVEWQVWAVCVSSLAGPLLGCRCGVCVCVCLFTGCPPCSVRLLCHHYHRARFLTHQEKNHMQENFLRLGDTEIKYWYS